MKNFGSIKFNRKGLSVEIYKNNSGNFNCFIMTADGNIYYTCFNAKIKLVEIAQEIEDWAKTLNVAKSVVFKWYAENLTITKLGSTYYVNHLGESMPCDGIEDALKYIEELLNA